MNSTQKQNLGNVKCAHSDYTNSNNQSLWYIFNHVQHQLTLKRKFITLILFNNTEGIRQRTKK